MVSKKTTIISISSNKELHGKGCQPRRICITFSLSSNQPNVHSSRLPTHNHRRLPENL